MTNYPTADGFSWDCRDCGFIGDWLTSDGRCPECGDAPETPATVGEREGLCLGCATQVAEQTGCSVEV